jgi:hypothetical protein
VFATRKAAEAWFAEIDPEGVAFEYWVLEKTSRHRAGLTPGLAVAAGGVDRFRISPATFQTF